MAVLKECSICGKQVEDGDPYIIHITDHQMQNMMAALQQSMRMAMLAPTAVQIAAAAAKTDKPVEHIVMLYGQAIKALMESGTF